MSILKDIDPGTTAQTDAQSQIPLTHEEMVRDVLLTVVRDIRSIKISLFHSRIIELVTLVGLIILGVVSYGNQNQLYNTTKDVGKQAAQASKQAASNAVEAVSEQVEAAVGAAVTDANDKQRATRQEQSNAALSSINAQAAAAAKKTNQNRK